MQARESWQALQRHLAGARAAADRGDRDTALAEIDAALAIDPDFLAAHALRDRVMTAQPAPPRPATARTVARLPDVSRDGYARFQERARQRRAETCVEAARDAIRCRRAADAAAAIEEIIQLDAARPEIADLTRGLHALRRRAERRRVAGPWLAAGLTFAATLFAASHLQDSSWLWSRPLVAPAIVIAPGSPGGVAAIDAAVGTSGGAEQASDSDLVDADAQPAVVALTGPVSIAVPVANAVTIAAPAPPPTRAAVEPAASVQPLPAPASPVVLQAPPLPPVAASELEPAPAVARDLQPAVAAVREPQPAVPAVREPQPVPPATRPAVDESALILNALQRYRTAYSDLDAASAQSVWPTVNESALARAFGSLESQSLTFDACDVRLTGEQASATCRGSARYVPKVGNREPRIEPRIWVFTLHKAAGDWKIETARAGSR